MCVPKGSRTNRAVHKHTPTFKHTHADVQAHPQRTGGVGGRGEGCGALCQINRCRLPLMLAHFTSSIPRHRCVLRGACFFCINGVPKLTVWGLDYSVETKISGPKTWLKGGVGIDTEIDFFLQHTLPEPKHFTIRMCPRDMTSPCDSNSFVANSRVLCPIDRTTSNSYKKLKDS